MALSASLGFPRMGAKRELKRALEAYWAGKIGQDELKRIGSEVRQRHWKMQQGAGIDHIPSNDFSYYDHMLDMTAMLGAVPERFQAGGKSVGLEDYFAMARGNANIKPMEMTKWFDTNYHYIVPEIEEGQIFSLSSRKVIDEFVEAKSLGVLTRPVLIGPVTYLMLAKSKEKKIRPIQLVDRVAEVYDDVLSILKREGAEWVQIDEPVLALDLEQGILQALGRTYRHFCGQEDRPAICLTTYFGGIEASMSALRNIAVEALHIDLIRAPAQLPEVMNNISDQTILSLGVVNGRNIWKTDLAKAAALIDQGTKRLGRDRVIIAPSCSLLHCPVDLEMEDKLPDHIKGRMAFAKQKLGELELIKRGLEQGWDSIQEEMQANADLFQASKTFADIHNNVVQEKIAGLSGQAFERQSPYSARCIRQQEQLNLPPLPTTTIGSFPQTSEIRRARADFKKGRVSREEYNYLIKNEIRQIIGFQEAVGLDVLVHGEPERNDMVEYFGQKLNGFVFTQHGWVQSYGSRCVKPPIIYGDVSRPGSMTVDWTSFAQSLTDRPVKGMLTGPITILQWSFVREDQPREDTAFQIALAVLDEVKDLEQAGIKVIQIDEPAFREGAPLKKSEWPGYFEWAVKAFKLATWDVDDATQIHTHMCYSEFNDIIESIGAMDADVVSMEASRSDVELLDVFTEHSYPNAIGPGVYDIHSPRVPAVEEIQQLLESMLEVFDRNQLWVNPDCGLKTRKWPEVEKSLKNMVEAAASIRNAVIAE